MTSREVAVDLPGGPGPVARVWETELGPLVVLPDLGLEWTEGTAYVLVDGALGQTFLLVDGRRVDGASQEVSARTGRQDLGPERSVGTPSPLGPERSVDLSPLGGGALLRTLRGAPPGGGVELDLAQPHGGRGHLDALVDADELEGLLQAEPARGREPDQLLPGGGADVGELLLLRRVDVHVLGAGVLADDHPPVHLHAGLDEELAACLEVQ